MKTFITGLVKGFGFLFFALNTAILIALLTLMAGAAIQTGSFSVTENALMLAFPILGMMAGWWLRLGRFGILRVFIIILSLLAAALILIIAFVITPHLGTTPPTDPPQAASQNF